MATDLPQNVRPVAAQVLEYDRPDADVRRDGWRFALRAATWAGMAIGLFAFISGAAALPRIIQPTNWWIQLLQWQWWLFYLAVPVGVLAGPLLLASGVGMLRMRPTARRVFVAAIGAIALSRLVPAVVSSLNHAQVRLEHPDYGWLYAVWLSLQFLLERLEPCLLPTLLWVILSRPGVRQLVEAESKKRHAERRLP